MFVIIITFFKLENISDLAPRTPTALGLHVTFGTYPSFPEINGFFSPLDVALFNKELLIL